MKKQVYQDDRGRKYFVMSNAGRTHDKPMYCAHSQEGPNSHTSITDIPEGLCWRKIWTEAQKDLNRLAEKNGWKPWP